MQFRVIEVIASTGFLTALECIKFVLGRGCAQTTLGEVTAIPQITWFKGPYF